jgi:hypothetical protein
VNPEPRLVACFGKNTREEVRAALTAFGGYRLADLRIWVEDREGEPCPTKKGLAVRVEHLPALRDAVEALIAAAAEEGDGA